MPSLTKGVVLVVTLATCSVPGAGSWPALPGWPVDMPDLAVFENIQPVAVDLNHDGEIEIAQLSSASKRSECMCSTTTGRT